MTNRLQVHDAIINHNAHYSNSRYASNYQPHGAQNGSPQIGITYGYQQIAIPSSELSYPSPKSNSEIAEAYPQTPMMVRLRTDDDDKMYPIPAYAMYPPGVIMPQQLSSYQSGVQAVVTQQSGVQTITQQSGVLTLVPQQSSGEEAAEAESPNASTVIAAVPRRLLAGPWLRRVPRGRVRDALRALSLQRERGAVGAEGAVVRRAWAGLREGVLRGQWAWARRVRRRQTERELVRVQHPFSLQRRRLEKAVRAVRSCAELQGGGDDDG